MISQIWLNSSQCTLRSVPGWTRNRSSPWTEDTCFGAARFGCLNLLKWLRAQNCPWDTVVMTVAAATSGSLDVLAWVHAQDCTLNVWTYMIARKHKEMQD